MAIIQRFEANLQQNWQKELANAISDPMKLVELLELNRNDYAQHSKARALFSMRVPLPFIKKMRKRDPNDPLLLQVLPSSHEFVAAPGYSDDPLKEQDNQTPGLLHKYKSRVLIIFRTGCAVNCRYCFRRHFPYSENHLNKQSLQHTLEYIRAHPEINEVILSGGDPLMAKDAALQWYIEQLETIAHLTRLRIHTRLPVVIPSRITEQLCHILAESRLKPVMVSHINHANEIDDDLSKAFQKLKQAGVTLLNQAVLLRGINDQLQDQVALSESLFKTDVLPYYLHVLDKVAGASHFDINEAEATQLVRQMLAELPGFLVPKLVREIGGEPSKTPLNLF